MSLQREGGARAVEEPRRGVCRGRSQADEAQHGLQVRVGGRAQRPCARREVPAPMPTRRRRAQPSRRGRRPLGPPAGGIHMVDGAPKL
jgi:hypothetical protein